MKVLEEIKVSVYENVYSKKPRVMSFLEVIIMCIHPIYASIINAIRRYHAEGDHTAAQKLKNQLPCSVSYTHLNSTFVRTDMQTVNIGHHLSCWM